MNLIILAAGRNSRLDQGFPKCLLTLNGETLLERHFRLFYKVGVRSICIVTGFRSEMVEEAVARSQKPSDLMVDLIFNPKYELENGYSLFRAAPWIREKGEFLLTMSDHLYNETFLQNFVRAALGGSSIVLACDTPGKGNDHIDIEDVTKVKADEKGRILDIGKSLTNYDLFDTGLFKMSPEVIAFMENSFARKEFTLSHIVKEGAKMGKSKVWLNDESGFWKDIDTPDDFEKAMSLSARL